MLDDIHSMVKVRWRSNFIKKDGALRKIVFENIYLVQNWEGHHKVFAWITPDERAALNEAGLL